jgi:hypothetical protein
MSESKDRSRLPKANTEVPRVDTGPVKPGNRHAAISNKLNTWRSYKSWVEKMRTTWDQKP